MMIRASGNSRLFINLFGNRVNQKTKLHSLKHEPSGDVVMDVYLKNYERQFKNLDREGLFYTIFNKVYDSQYNAIPHFLAAKFEAFNDQECFYMVKSGNLEPVDAEEIFLLFNLN